MTTLENDQQNKSVEQLEENEFFQNEEDQPSSEHDISSSVILLKRKRKVPPTAREKKIAKLKNILKKVYSKERDRLDREDISRQPSFSNFEVPYFIKCRNRYNGKKQKYEDRFHYEIEQLIAQQPTGYEAARLTRHMGITTFWPPLHSVTEIGHTQRNFFRLKDKERQRLELIMASNLV